MPHQTHPRATAASMSHSPKLAARLTGLTVNDVRRIRDLQLERASRRVADPLVIAARTRAVRTRSHLAALDAARAAAVAAAAIEAQAEARRQEIRATLLRAARVARASGYTVDASRDPAGRVSSYYVAGPRRVRISDHEIPETGARTARAEAAGEFFYAGFRGPEIIIRRGRSARALRRALLLAMAGRAAPWQ